MKTNLLKSLFAGALISLSGSSMYAQSASPCNTSEAEQKIFAKYPELIKQTADYEAQLQQLIQAKKGMKAVEQIYTIPIVFHVIYVNTAQNVSDANINALVNRLNADFRKTNSDTTLIANGFNSIAADSKIQFALAKIDPNGNCTNGIDRIYSHKTYLGSDESKLNPWPRDKYFNVWVVDNIPSDGAGTTLGYAYKPATVQYAPMSNFDGIIMIYNQVNGNSRTLTHEAGHWMSLSHTWGDGEINVACGDDGVTDTPETKGHFSTCPASDTTCGGIQQNINNYMDYSSCVYMYTFGQKDKMRAALESSVAERNNLWSAANLAATGVSPAGGPCAPKADFSANRSIVCVGGTVTFTKQITNGTATSTKFYFGSPSDVNPATSTSTASTVTATYNTPGVYPVSFVATNAQGTDSIYKTSYITVTNAYGDFQGNGYQESFENENSFWYNWRVNNMDQNPNTFGIANVGYNSSKSAVMEGYNNYFEDVDELISPALNLAFVNSAVMTFQYSAASRATSAAVANEALKVYYTANCGQTWTILGGGTMTGTNLANFGFYNGYYVPSSASMWNTKTINLPAAACVQNVRFKFVYETGEASNNVYIDNINISGAVGVEENLNSFALNVYPNPSNQMSTISYRLTEKSAVKLEVYDVLGKKVADLANANQSEGAYSVEVSKADNNLKNGIYFIRLSVNNAVTTTKLVITE